MADYVCMIQQGQEPERVRHRLEEGLKRIGRETFGDDPETTEISWVVYPKGYAWTEGRPSTSSIVIRSVPVGYDDELRETFLREVCDLWQSVAGCSINEIVVTAWDGPLPL